MAMELILNLNCYKKFILFMETVEMPPVYFSKNNYLSVTEILRYVTCRSASIMEHILMEYHNIQFCCIQ